MEIDYNSKVIDDLYEIRDGEVKTNYIAKCGKPKEDKKANEVEDDLVNFIKKFIKNDEDIHELYGKINQFELYATEQMCFWYKPYYKQGFIDGINLIRETQEQRNISNKINNELKENSFFYNYIDSISEFIEYNRFNIWQKKEEYQEITNKISSIKSKYPKIRLLIDDEIITELSTEELQALLEYINLDNSIEKLEQLEIFKLGIKEGKLL